MPHQQVLVDLGVAIQVREVGSAVQRREALGVALVDFGSEVEQVVKHIELAVCVPGEGDRGEREEMNGKRAGCARMRGLDAHVTAKCTGAPAPLSCVTK